MDGFDKLISLDIKWCKLMGYFNPYIDSFKYLLSPNIPPFDKSAYIKYPEHNFVYDKLFIIQSQGLMGGTLESLIDSPSSNIQYPIFIKPRWGHKTASSKNCFKIESIDELQQFKNYKNMMWSEFYKDNENMTDFFLKNGQIVHQITYIYSDEKKGFIDVWKVIASNNKPPTKIVEWVIKHLQNFTGVVNVQYRADNIIEVGLRAARGGAYINSTGNEALINNINDLIDNNTWNHGIQEQMKFEPFWSYKCYIDIPLIYILPQYLLDLLMSYYQVKSFYEYYFEPNGKDGMVFLQFLHDDFEKGLKTQSQIESIFIILQYFFYLVIILCIVILTFYPKKSIYLIPLILLFLTRFMNPMVVNYNLFKIQKQDILGASSTENLHKHID